MKKNFAQLTVNFLISLIIGLLYIPDLSSQVKLSEQDWVIPTYPVDEPDRNPMFFRNESYQGASRYIYPYALNDVISGDKTDKVWKTVTLENEYIKLCVTPEIGGKLYYATDKTDNYNFVYKNNVVKPSNIGMLGAWVSGGIEWCVLHHHRASTFLPVDYTSSENTDGSKTIWIGETEPRHRMRWTIGITMFPGRSYFQSEVKITNPTPFTNTFLYWANVAAHTNENYQVVFPPSVNIATYHAKNSFTHWPVSTEIYNGQDFTKGVDISWWKNSAGSNSFFAYDLQEDFMGGYDHGKEAGTVHIGDHNIIKGAKLWEWGSGAAGQATEARLTDNDGPYVEIMVGAFSDNQPDYSWIRPYEVKTFKQYWYPVKEIKGFKNANLNGAVNLESTENSQVFLGYYSTRKVNQANIILKKNNKIIFSTKIEISPEKPFTKNIKIDGQYDMTELSTEMTDSETGEVLISYHPVKPKYTEKLPDVVKRPELPENIPTVEELYLTGSRIQQFYNPTLNAMDYFAEALKRDPYDIPTNTAVGNIYLKNGDYLKARSYFSKAVKRLTKDFTRPSNCETLYLQGLTLKALGLTDEAVDTLYRASWDYSYHSAALLELARISCMKLAFPKALDQVTGSLSTNSLNNSAVTLKASIERRLGKYIDALAMINDLRTSDPLDFRAGNEYYLILKRMGKNKEADKALSDLTIIMRDFDQNYLELGIGYLNDGLVEEAADVFERFKGRNPIILYYLGYIQDMFGNKVEADRLFRAGSELPADYVFPFRLETIKVLNIAATYRQHDAKPWYYLGNLLYDKQPVKAIECWEKAVKLDSSFAIAYRNLGWGYLNTYNNGEKAIKSYEKAIGLKKDDPVYYAELDELYEMSNAHVEKRMTLFEGSNEIVRKRDDSFVRQLVVLTLAGKPEKAVEYLAGRNFNYREGNSRVREIIIDAQLMLGRKYMAEKDYQKALEHFQLARIPDEEGGSARAGNRDVQVNYYIGLAYEAIGKRSTAKRYFALSTKQIIRAGNYIGYYQGLSWIKLGITAKATTIFNELISEGDKLINRKTNSNVDFFAKFGEQEAANVQVSNAYLLKGLGYKGLGDNKAAKENLQKAVELSVSNLYANVELQSL